MRLPYCLEAVHCLSTYRRADPTRPGFDPPGSVMTMAARNDALSVPDRIATVRWIVSKVPPVSPAWCWACWSAWATTERARSRSHRCARPRHDRWRRDGALQLHGFAERASRPGAVQRCAAQRYLLWSSSRRSRSSSIASIASSTLSRAVSASAASVSTFTARIIAGGRTYSVWSSLEKMGRRGAAAVEDDGNARFGVTRWGDHGQRRLPLQTSWTR